MSTTKKIAELLTQVLVAQRLILRANASTLQSLRTNGELSYEELAALEHFTNSTEDVVLEPPKIDGRKLSWTDERRAAVGAKIREAALRRNGPAVEHLHLHVYRSRPPLEVPLATAAKHLKLKESFLTAKLKSQQFVLCRTRFGRGVYLPPNLPDEAEALRWALESKTRNTLDPDDTIVLPHTAARELPPLSDVLKGLV